MSRNYIKIKRHHRIKKRNRIILYFFTLFFLGLIIIGGSILYKNNDDWDLNFFINEFINPTNVKEEEKPIEITLDDIPVWTKESYVKVNNNKPTFTKNEIKNAYISFENYDKLDELGRAGAVTVSISNEDMPEKEREELTFKPTGWKQNRYENIIEDGPELYNRCHIIGYQLTGKNDYPLNLITCTRYMNVQGMLPFENIISSYLRKTDNHVLYRVTPMYYRDDLLARGVLMEAYSVEDKGKGVSFCVFAYNVQPGIAIDYSTGDNKIEEN